MPRLHQALLFSPALAALALSVWMLAQRSLCAPPTWAHYAVLATGLGYLGYGLLRLSRHPTVDLADPQHRAHCTFWALAIAVALVVPLQSCGRPSGLPTAPTLLAAPPR